MGSVYEHAATHLVINNTYVRSGTSTAGHNTDMLLFGAVLKALVQLNHTVMRIHSTFTEKTPTFEIDYRPSYGYIVQCGRIHVD